MCFAILVIPMFLNIIIGVVADLTRWIAESIIDGADWLKIKMMVRDEDPD